MKKKRLIFVILGAVLLLSACAPKEPAAGPSLPTVSEEPGAAAPPGPSGPAETPVTQEPPPEPAQTKPEQPDRAEELLAGMTLEEKVGQMFFVRCPEEDAEGAAENYQLGGYILFGNDFKNETPDSLRGKIEGYQSKSKIPMLIGVDEEGGPVVRLSRYKAFRGAPFLSPQELYKKGGFDLVGSDAAEKAELLKSLGINVNLAPVCDVSTDPGDYIYKRTFGKSAKETAEYVKRVVRETQGKGVGATLKHFPGYGNNLDTHSGASIDTRSYSVFENSDFLPFEAGIQAGADIVLVSHNIVFCMDTAPASLSKPVHEILRKELKFDGLIMTDDLYMDAIRDYAGVGEAAVLAVEAGNDLLCSTEFEEQIAAVINAVKEGRIPEERIDESVLKILRMKLKLGIAE